jgi:spatacsin
MFLYFVTECCGCGFRYILVCCYSVIILAGESVSNRVSEPLNDERLQCRSSAAFSSESWTEPSRSDLKDDIPYTSASVKDFDNGFSLEHEFSRSNNSRFVCDVNSLAWGV